MSPDLAAKAMLLFDLSQQALAIGFYVFLRIGAAMAVLPVFGEQIVPVRVRLGLAVAFTLVVSPAVAAQIAPLVAAEKPSLMPLFTETLAGLMVGLSVRLFFLALQMAGTIAAQSISLAQFFGGAGVEPQPAISQLLLAGGMCLAVLYGLHVQLAQLLVLSYDLLPPGVFPTGADSSRWGLASISHAVALAFSLAAPFVIASLIYNVALGVINRAMPHLMVSFVGAPALALGGLLLLFLVVPLAMGVWIVDFGLFFATPFAGER